ncbi:hypothetical protein [Pseudoalteromonas luteoviolacea]|uniref:hypothetical protein n=1 Tax=Pseudoalteromonas luteoviolacea TaxID=43657 RepID=UPI001B386A58|nr:hypothetical protein [Pseudoalteromonas luteoviolacea]MBQ4836610.1 hypothetical protein [Pseudoalteromonas luteoviolacea]
MKKIFAFALLCAPFISSANTGAFLIKHIQVEHGHVYMWGDGMQNPKNCDISGVVKLDKTKEGFDQMYSLALTAMASGKKIGFWASHCGATPWGGKNTNTAYAAYIKP